MSEENINFCELKDEFLRTMIIRALTRTAEEYTEEGIHFHNVPGWEDLESTDLRVSLKINDVEVPFSKLFQNLHKAYKEDVREKARELLEEKFNATFDKLGEFRDAICDVMLRELREKFNVDLKETDPELFEDEGCPEK